jgi:hypothetical protein
MELHFLITTKTTARLLYGFQIDEEDTPDEGREKLVMDPDRMEEKYGNGFEWSWYDSKRKIKAT